MRFSALSLPQTLKLSPQPQAPFAFGFSKTKPAAKSSSTQSMTLPIKYSTDAPGIKSLEDMLAVANELVERERRR